MRVYTYSEARQKLASVLEQAENTGKVLIRRKDGRTFALVPGKNVNTFPVIIAVQHLAAFFLGETNKPLTQKKHGAFIQSHSFSSIRKGRTGDSSLPDDRANFGPEDMHIKDSKRNEITRNVSLTWAQGCVYKFKRLPDLPDSFFAGMFEPGY